jgi:hypothetical protein
MNYLIGWSINSWKIEIVNELINKWEIKKEDIIHWDDLRKELFDSLSKQEQKKLFPKMYKIFSWEEKWIDLIERIWIEEYLRLEKEESKVVFERKIRPIIDNMTWDTNKVIVWVQLLPELINEAIKWNNSISTVYMVRDNVSDILTREFQYAQESEWQKKYIERLSANKIKKWEAENQYLLHAKAKAEYWKMIIKEIKDLWLDSLVVNTTDDFRNKILGILDIIIKK